MTIEERALALWGEAHSPPQALWILQDGRIVNGCQGGYVRDVDHSEIGQFFKLSKFHEPGSGYLYVCKFIRRGNIRVHTEGAECCFQYYRTPSYRQWQAMSKIAAWGRHNGKGSLVERMKSSRRPWRSWDFDAFRQHLEKYAPRSLGLL